MNRAKDNLIKFYSYFSITLILFIIFTIFYFIFIKGFFEINLGFLLENPKGTPLGSDGGIRNAIIGSFLLMFISTSFSMILGVSCAIYNKIFCESKSIQIVIKFIVSTVSSIPSIILGLFVYGFFIVNLSIPRGLLTASITLSLMTFSFVEINIEKSIDELDRQFFKDSFALGMDKYYMSRKMVLPLIRKNILSTFILAGSYAIGATAPLILTGVVFITNVNGLFTPVMALPFHLHTLLSQSVGIEKAYATSFVLILILLLLHIISEVILRNLGGKLVEYIRNKKS